jgi:hypothetical protein
LDLGVLQDRRIGAAEDGHYGLIAMMPISVSPLPFEPKVAAIGLVEP